MPDLVTHYYFGSKVYDNLGEQIKEHISSYDIYAFTTAGPDPFFFYKFTNAKENLKVREFGNFMHKNKSKDFFLELTNITKNSDNKDLMFSYLCGFITHYALDSHAHPYIFHLTGVYLNNQETKEYRGLHTKLERAIDSYIIRNKYNIIPWKFKISKEILTLKHMPITIKDDLNKLYKKVYNFDNAYNVIEQTVKDQRKFYSLIYDPMGIKNWIFTKIDNKTSSIDFSKLSYYKKELPQYDILNQNHQEWLNPVDKEIKSTDDFQEIITKSLRFALSAIEAVYKVIYLDNDIDLEYYFQNLSYLTGISCDRLDKDDMQYFNNIFK